MNRLHKKRLLAGIAIVIALTAMLTVSIFVIGQRAVSEAGKAPEPPSTGKQTERRIYITDPELPPRVIVIPEETEDPSETVREAEETDNVVIRRVGSETEDVPETEEIIEETEVLIPETEPETEAPETNAPETKAPETEAPETRAPETEAPETRAPETEAPETRAPETEAPETRAPETEAPETRAPETEAPETRAPETEAPETRAPETEAPETRAPETEAPETEAPETEAPETEAPETEAPETEPPAPPTPPTPPTPDDPMYGPYGNFHYNIYALTGGTRSLTDAQQDIIAKACRDYGVELELAYALMATETVFGYNLTHANSGGSIDWGILQLNDCNFDLLRTEFPISSMSDIITDFELSVRTGVFVVQFAKNNVFKAGYDTDAWRVAMSYHYYILDAEKKWNNYGWTCEKDGMNDTYCNIVMGWYHKFLDAKYAYEATRPAAG